MVSLGIAMLVLLFGGVFVWMSIEDGFGQTLEIFASVFALAIFVAVALYLLAKGGA